MIKFWQSWVIADKVQRFEDLPESFICFDDFKKMSDDYEKLKTENEIMKSRATQFESTLRDTMRARDQAMSDFEVYVEKFNRELRENDRLREEIEKLKSEVNR